jgi:hypothetical protein
MESHINSFGFLFNQAESIFHARVDMGTQMACLGAYTSRITILNMIAWDFESRGKNRGFPCAFFLSTFTTKSKCSYCDGHCDIFTVYSATAS